MKRWAALTIVLYLLCLSVLVVPTILLMADDNEEVLSAFYFYAVPVMLLVQVLLLAVPIAVAEGRPVARRTVLSAVVLGALPMGILAAAVTWFAALIVFGERAIEDDWFGWLLLGILGLGWVFWSVVFHRCYASDGPKAFTGGIARWLLRGSILEMLVAIPSHIIARERHECCAPAFTLFGLATGISIALLSFGPGVFLLLVGRTRSKRGESAD